MITFASAMGLWLMWSVGASNSVYIMADFMYM